jgi:drug/metabolite transporter (DMT)-like permease
MTAPQTTDRRATAAAAMPAVFVLLWSTGFIGAKLGLPYAEPMTFLTLRFAIGATLLLVVVLLFRAPWPATWREAGHIAMAGLLLHGLYLGCVFASIGQGVEAGVSALIVSIQPLVVAAAAGPLLGERVSRLQWLGLALGILGVTLVVWRKLALGLGSPLGMGLSVVALLGLAAATLYQKRFCQDVPLRSGNVIQLAVAAAATGILALAFETGRIESLGAFMLLYLMIRQGTAARVSSLFYLVPPSTAVIAFLLFGERFGPLALVGMALAVAGVGLVNLRR